MQPVGDYSKLTEQYPNIVSIINKDCRRSLWKFVGELPQLFCCGRALQAVFE